jgi:hypothetical protein
MEDFNFGPFQMVSGEKCIFNGNQTEVWHLYFDNADLACERISGTCTRKAVVDALSEHIHSFTRSIRTANTYPPVKLIRYCDDSVLATLRTKTGFVPGMSSGMMNDGSEHWVVHGTKATLNRPVSLLQWTHLATQHCAAENDWITGILPSCVVTADEEAWRPPTEHELRCVVGEHSFTGKTGAACANLVGVTPQNFRKYTAAEGASTRQKMSFAMWHLLLHRLGIQTP